MKDRKEIMEALERVLESYKYQDIKFLEEYDRETFEELISSLEKVDFDEQGLKKFFSSFRSDGY